MHKAGSTDQGFGFHMDNTIGSTPQHNPWTADWVTFFRDHRLGFQLKLIKEQYGDNDLYAKGQRLLEKLPLLLQGLDNVQPCLLHGDLWSGNVVTDSNGSPVILDPACYCMSLFFSQILESCLVSEISSLNHSTMLAC
jgi:protein-ribulosamine 3-kinase